MTILQYLVEIIYLIGTAHIAIWPIWLLIVNLQLNKSKKSFPHKKTFKTFGAILFCISLILPIVLAFPILYPYGYEIWILILAIIHFAINPLWSYALRYFASKFKISKTFNFITSLGLIFATISLIFVTLKVWEYLTPIIYTPMIDYYEPHQPF